MMIPSDTQASEPSGPGPDGPDVGARAGPVSRRQRSVLGDVIIYALVTIIVIGLLIVVNDGVRYLLGLLRKLLDAAP